MSKLVKLFEPGTIGKMELKNRIVMAPMGTFSADNGHISQKAIDYYLARARGGVGLIISEFTAISRRAPGGRTHCALWDDEFIPELRELVEKVHQYGAKIAVQLGHHGLQQSDPGRLLGYRPEDIDIVEKILQNKKDV